MNKALKPPDYATGKFIATADCETTNPTNSQAEPDMDTKHATDEHLRGIPEAQTQPVVPARQTKRTVKQRAPQFSRQRLRDETARELSVISEADYVHIGGLQYALPYVHTFTMHYRARWDGLTLLEVFVAEFNHVDEAYWQHEFEGGRVRTNGTLANASTRWHDD
eukprot:IDg16507t1